MRFESLVMTMQVQPDMEELEGNMEDNEDVESPKEEEKLGRLHFTLDYDFQKSEVRHTEYFA